MKQKILFEYLSRVNKPGHFIGNEINVISKNAENLYHGTLLAPSAYNELMSSGTFRRLYVLLNKSIKAYWQRAFLPELGNDFDALSETGISLFTLEENTEVYKSDIVIIYVKDILEYLKFYHLFSAIDLPVFRQQRKSDSPVFIAAGPGLVNPHPIAPFVDAFYIGDIEILPQQIDKCLALPFTRDQFLDKLKTIAGIVVLDDQISPNFEDDISVVRQFIPELNARYFPGKLPVPHIDIKNKSYHIEINRGSFSPVRSSMSDYIFRPLRTRRVEDIILEIKNASLYEGARVFEIDALHPEENDNLLALIKRLKILSHEMDFRFFIKGFLFNPDSDIDDALKNTAKNRFEIQLLTIDPGLRLFLNMEYAVRDIEKMIYRLVSLGWEHFSFKILLGIPGESEAEVTQIADWINILGEKFADKPKITFLLEVDQFFPAPFSPLQWEECITANDFKKRVEILEKQIYNKQCIVKVGSSFEGALKTVLYRGSEDDANFLNKDLRSPEEWYTSFIESEYKNRLHALSLYDTLPWAGIDLGVSANFLHSERMKAFDRKPTPTCRIYKCYNCGLQRPHFKGLAHCYELAKEHPVAGKYDHILQRFSIPKERVLSYGRDAKKSENQSQQLVKKVRIEYIKKGFGRFLTHQDLGRLLDVASRISGFPIAYTQGKIPKAKMSFGLPLPLGFESDGEYIDVDILVLKEADMLEKINRLLPQGIMINSARALYKKTRSLVEIIDEVEYCLDFEEGQKPADLIYRELQKLSEKPEIIINAEGTENAIDIKEYFKEIKQKPGKVFLRLAVFSGKTVRPTELLDLCPSWVNERFSCSITRTGQVNVSESGEKKTPMELTI